MLINDLRDESNSFVKISLQIEAIPFSSSLEMVLISLEFTILRLFVFSGFCVGLLIGLSLQYNCEHVDNVVCF